MRILLLGKTGQLGLDLQKTLKSLGELISLDSSQLNLEQTSQIGETVRAIKPDVIVNAAAYTKVDRAEIEPDMAYIVNAQAPKVLAEEAKLLGALLILFSTDYVFDGAKKGAYSETDFVSPKNIYGATKLRGENYILQVDGLHLILRTSWVYSLFGNNFMTKVLDWAKKEDILRITQDQFGSPTWTVWLAQITAYVVQCYQHLGLEWMMTQKGLYHVASEGIVKPF